MDDVPEFKRLAAEQLRREIVAEEAENRAAVRSAARAGFFVFGFLSGCGFCVSVGLFVAAVSSR